MKTRVAVITGIILLAAASRLIPHPYNFAPITAIALFGGAHFRNKVFAFLVPMSAMLLSDTLLGFHNEMPGVYLSFGLIVLIGRWVRKNQTALRIGEATVGSSFLFFVLTNLWVWIVTPQYAKTIAGLTACYTMALPFFHNTLAGDLLYSTVLFGGFALVERMIPILREERVLAY